MYNAEGSNMVPPQDKGGAEASEIRTADIV